MRQIGAIYSTEDKECTFIVWAPFRKKLSVIINHNGSLMKFSMERDDEGYWTASVRNLNAGDEYLYLLDDEVARPDPASGYQPHGVHGPSAIINHEEYVWKSEEWRGIPLTEMIIYEIHIGTFTERGTFDAAVEKLDHVTELGCNAVEVMPIAQFSGRWNWGYDGVFPYAVQNSYGGPTAFKRFVDECHKRGIAVILDVVYNHLGPEGNYLADFGPYFSEKYKTPWGKAINFDGEYSDHVRNFFIMNAIYWFDKFRVDALRLDAIHAIFDQSSFTFLEELKEAVKKLEERKGRRLYLIAESDLGDVRVIKPRSLGGYGLDAQWLDDFHHSVHAFLTGERDRYYMDFGEVHQIRKTFSEGYVYDGIYSKYRRRKHGSKTDNVPVHKFVVFVQNHDQVGNRPYGERLAKLLDFESLKLAAGLYLLSPYVPLIFMGEEFGDDSPFLFFVDFSDPLLRKTVKEGRRKEFGWEFEIPDPCDEVTFYVSKVKWSKLHDTANRTLFSFYKELIKLRRSLKTLKFYSRWRTSVTQIGNGDEVLDLRSQYGRYETHIIYNLSSEDKNVEISVVSRLVKVLESSSDKWGGPGERLPHFLNEKNAQLMTFSPRSFAVFTNEYYGTVE